VRDRLLEMDKKNKIHSYTKEERLRQKQVNRQAGREEETGVRRDSHT
jgi:hypothetical protein